MVLNILIGDVLRRLQWWLIYLGPRRDVTVDTSNGRLTIDSKDWLIGKYLYVKRSYEANQIRAAIALLQKEGHLREVGRKTVIDVGANIGMISIALLRQGYFERAIAFEPAPDSYRLLARNVSQNGFQDRILHFRCALSSIEGELELELSDDNSGDHRIRRTKTSGAFREERRRTVKVPIRTLDRVFSDHLALRSEEVGLVWLDIQGHEGQFFQGARDLLRRGIPVVSELWPYAILRSGMWRSDFCRILSELFTHFYLLAREPYERLPISKIGGLFDAYSAPKQMCQVALVRNG